MSENKQGVQGPRQTRKKTTRAIVELLENRTLFSADLLGAFIDPAANDDSYQGLVDTTADSPVLTQALPDEPAALLPSDPLPSETNSAAQQAVVQELLIIDGNTPDAERIVNDILAQAEGGRRIEIVILDPALDGLTQLNALFASYQSLDAVHVISHGSDGALQLGNGVLTLETLQENAADISAWASAFSENGDFLIYGCNLAASNEGQHFIDALGQLTGTEVAASDDLTGSAQLGGDWLLEYTSGHIESSLAVSIELQSSYEAVLVNSAPVLSGANNFTSINEDNTNSSGTLVSSLIAGKVTDVDGGAQGIAIIAVDNTNGSWQYTTDGVTWTNIPAVNQYNAELLAADANNAVRFVPNANYNGTVTNGITFYAWDQSAGSDASLMSTVRTETVLDNFSVQSYSNNNGTQNWSGNWIEVNDGSGATGGDFSVQSGQLRLNGTSTSDYIYRQADLSGALSATLSFSYNNDLYNFFLGNEAIQLQVSGNGGSSWTTLYTFTESNNGTGSQSYDISSYIASNTQVRFKVSASDGSSSYFLHIDNFQIAYDVSNTGASAPFSSASASSSITVTAVNDAPVNTLPASQTLNEDISTALTGISITDVDGNVSSAQLGVTQGKLTVDLAGGATISAGANNSSTLTLSGTQAQINAALSTLSYLGNLNYYGTDTLTLTSTDSSAASDTDTMSITVSNVNDPISISSSASVSVAENQSTAYTITVFNPDLAETVTYSIDNTGTTSLREDNAKVSVNASTGVVTFLSVPNFESPSDATPDNVYHIKVKVNDNNGYTDFLFIAITITNANDAPTGTVSISGTATENQLLTASNTLADQDGLGAISYQWLRNGVNITGATASTYSLGDADVGKNISVRASYTDGAGFANSVTSTATAAVANVNDVPVGLPAITGTATENQTLTADTSGISDADGLGAFSYQWLRNGSAVTGATGSTYTLGDADVGKNISVRVSYTDGQGTSENLTSAATAAVVNVNDAPVGLPVINGTLKDGQTLTADSASISDADGLGVFSYQWKSNGVNVGGNSSTYILQVSDVGNTLTVTITYTDGQGTLETVTSSATGVVSSSNAAPTGSVSIDNTNPNEGAILSASNTLADPDGPATLTVSYQWYRDGALISGATGASYTTVQADVGKAITVVGSYVDGLGVTEIVSSAATAAVINVNDAPTGLPVISGTTTENQMLTADTTGISDEDGLGVFSYQWLRDGVAIGGATGSTYTLGDADVGTLIRVQVTYTDGYGTVEGPLTSAATSAITNVNDVPLGLPAITGTATQNQTLTADTSGISDADGLGAFSYQWQRDGVAIGGATGSTYTLGNADVGAQISVQVSYNDSHGTVEGPLTSALTTAVVNVNDAPTLVTLSNTVVDENTDTSAGYSMGGLVTSDVDVGDTATYSIVGGADAALFSIGGLSANELILTNGILNFENKASYTVIVRSTDSGALFHDQTFTITVNNVNEAPVNTVPGPQTVAEDTALALGGLSVNDVDGNLSTVQLSVGQGNLNVSLSGAASISAGANSSGSLTLSGSQTDLNATLATLSYQGNLNFNGSDTLTILSTDSAGVPLSDTDTVAITVTAVNDVPVAVADSFSTNEDTVLSGTVSSNDTASGDGGNVWSLNTGASNGTVVVNADGSFTYTPNANFNGSDSFSYTLTDVNGDSSTATVSLTVVAVNDLPVAVADSLSTNEDTVLSGTVSSNDTASGDGGNVWSLNPGASNGTVVVNADGSFTYTPNANFNGSDSFSYTLTDVNGDSSTATVSLTVVAVNDAPINTVPGPQTVNEDTALTLSGLSVNDVDGNLSTVQLSVGQGSLSVSLVGGATISAGANASSSLTLSGSSVDINATLATLSYQGNLNFNGSDTLTMVSTDSAGVPLSDSDTVAITVTAVNDAPVGLPTITGTATENQTLSADTSSISDADGLGAFSYQWLRNGSAIGGATSSTYTLGNADVGTQISVQVSYTDSHGTSEGPLTSSATAAITNVNDAPVGLPAITGTATENQTLSADTSSISDADGLGAFSYQWLRNGSVIGGATGSTYILGNADVGTLISVQVSYTDSHGTSEGPLTSSATSAVINVNDAPVGLPAITGIATENQTLTADTTGISDADGLGAFSYQWLRNGSAIGGATSSTYTLGNADVGTQISVQVTYTDGQGTLESVSSASTAAVLNVNDAPTGTVSINNNSPAQGDLLSASHTLADADGLGTVNYQWLRNGSAISGATAATYITVQADVGSTLSVVASYTDGHATLESVSSASTAAVSNVNDVPVFGGVGTGTVTKNTLSNGSTLLQTSGRLSISDPDSGESAFQAASIKGTYGQLSINATGDWIYQADNTQAAIQQLTELQTLTDILVVTSLDGSTYSIVLTIQGSTLIPVTTNTVVSSSAEPVVTESTNALTNTLTVTNQNTFALGLLVQSSDKLDELLLSVARNATLASMISNEVIAVSQANTIDGEFDASLTGAEKMQHIFIKSQVIESKFIELNRMDISWFNEDFAIEMVPVQTILNNHAFINEINNLHKDLDDVEKAAEYNEQLLAEVSTGLSISLTAGLVSWMLRGGSLLASFMSVSPFWKQLDPLPILNSDAVGKKLERKNHADDADDDEADKSVEKIFDEDDS